MTNLITLNRRHDFERRGNTQHSVEQVFGRERRLRERRAPHSWRYVLIVAGHGFDELDLMLLLPLTALVIFAIFAPIGSLEPYFR